MPSLTNKLKAVLPREHHYTGNEHARWGKYRYYLVGNIVT